MFKHNRMKLQSIKIETAQRKEMLESLEDTLRKEWAKKPAPEVRIALEKLEISVAKSRVQIKENEALIAKLERPIWKLF